MRRLNESFGVWEEDEPKQAEIESKKYYCKLCGEEYCPNIGAFCVSCWQKILRSKVPEEYYIHREKNISGIQGWIQK